MTPQKDRIQEIFAQAKEKKSPAERERFLAEACRGEPELRREVESLLRAHEQAGDFLGQTVKLTESDFVLEKTGVMIGRYKLLEKIGEGGFGTVYMAEQQQPVQRKVALKIIKAGMDTREVVVRFEAERQALALMDHPNIARVLDAGATDAGRPYFVMELVRGMPITDYCDRSNLPTRGRLQLFMKVCHAVQHAHQKGIIHRDLKPSNVLVTLHDGEPVPKVIDFGIAKALGQKLTEKTLFTGFQHMIGTPAYMSPEQAELSGLDIDTRADIYSLGVLLYELLTGVTPFDRETLAKAALDEIRRMIRETEPPKPSTRLQTLGDKLTEVAKHRQSAPAALSRLVRGDLDWITMKCLEKDRTRRYETASGLANDIQRHLTSEPVVACPPSSLYRFQKMVRRNQLAFAAGSTIAVSLLIGLGVSTTALNQERKARQLARMEAAKSARVAGFLQDMLKSVNPSVALGRDTTMLRDILDNTAERIGPTLTDQPEVEVELRTTLAHVYSDLGVYDRAEAMNRRVLALKERLFTHQSQEVARALTQLGNVLWQQRKFSEAEARHREALAIRRHLLGNAHPAVAWSLNDLAFAVREQNKPGEAEMLHREALAIFEQVLGDDDPAVAASLGNLASVLSQAGKRDEVETVRREALAMRERLRGKEHAGLANLLEGQANSLLQERKPGEAEVLFRDVLTLRRKLVGEEHPAVAWAHHHLGGAFLQQDKLTDAEAEYQRALTMFENLFGREHPAVATTLDNLARTFEKQGKRLEADAAFRRAESLRKNQSKPNREE